MTHTSVRRTKRLISAREFQEWQEVYKIEPFGDDWEQAGTVAATMVNMWSKKKVDWRRFLPNANQKRRKTPQQIETEMMHFARMHNAAIDAKARKAKG